MARDESRIPWVGVVQRHPQNNIKGNKQVVSQRHVTQCIWKNLWGIKMAALKSTVSQAWVANQVKSASCQWPIQPELIPVSTAWSDQVYFHSPLHVGGFCWFIAGSQIALNSPVHTWVERGSMRVKCPEHNTITPGPQGSNQYRSIRSPTWPTIRSRRLHVSGC